MKKTLYLLLSAALLSTAAQATPRHHRHRQPVAAEEKEMGEPAGYSSLVEVRAARLTSYFAEALHLSLAQTHEVHSATLTKLLQLNATAAPGTALQRYDAAMLRILTPGQYDTFRWLEERQSLSDMLQPTPEVIAQH